MPPLTVKALTVPYCGQQLSGAALLAQLKVWREYGCAEPAAMDAIAATVNNPEWMDLRGHHFIILGATSAMGPLCDRYRGLCFNQVALPIYKIYEYL